MTVSVLPKRKKVLSSELIRGGLEKILQTEGRLPPVEIRITPIEGNREIVWMQDFLDYTFDSSVLIPVDSFSFTFSGPDGDPFYEQVKEGDIISLYANDVPLSAGIIDTIEIDTETESGERVLVAGRDLLSQFEDQDAVSVDTKPLYAQNIGIQGVFQKLAGNTRIQSNGLELRNPPSNAVGLFATSPGKSKLTAFQRYLEPLNCLFWMGPTGKLVVGKPSFDAKISGTFKMIKSRRESNCTSMKVVYAAANIPNIVVPIWSGQEFVTERLPSQRVDNTGFGPTRLRSAGHRVPKAIVVSTPVANNPQGLSDVNFFTQNSNVLLAMAYREIARRNKDERVVQVVVPSHYNEAGDPFLPDTVYKIEYERGSVDAEMYLFHVQYTGSEANGQRTTLHFCNKYTIVAGNKMRGGKV